ncbi:MAG TPA: class I SAM-dependent methyltransferase [Candidatus Paceibacterota bacterium]|nr:class I SAM-dependent methyltransferase [Candidatus Paceibacterota bacterium]
MTHDAHLLAAPWSDYELLDSGDGKKLERFGPVILIRPETQALWRPNRPELWESANAEFAFHEKGDWKLKKAVPDSWPLAFGTLRFTARLTGFKHTGVFPEQSPNWTWITERAKALGTSNVLNLFGYTGIASLAAAAGGASVTHVDASKQSLDWAHDNARLSSFPENKIRWLFDDALAFAKREVRRGSKYDGIILDPPAFGRGAKGEVWKIEEGLPLLLETLKDLLADTEGAFFLLNGYAAGYAPRSLAQSVESVFGAISGESGELHIKETCADRVVPSGIYVRFTR